MDNSHLYIMIIVLSLFAILGNIFGLIIHSKAPQYVKEDETVKNCFIGLIVSFVFILLFVVIYAIWHILHHHKEERHIAKASPKAYRHVNTMGSPVHRPAYTAHMDPRSVKKRF